MVEVKNENVLIRFQLWHVLSVCSAKKKLPLQIPGGTTEILLLSACWCSSEVCFFLPVDEAIKAMPAVDE